MDYCSRCGDTGKAVNGKYCRCTKGKFLKLQEDGKKKAEIKRMQEETANNIAKDAKETTPAKKGINPYAEAAKEYAKQAKRQQAFRLTYYSIGDWVKVAKGYVGAGSIGYVVKVGDENNYKVKFIKYHDGRDIDKTQWAEDSALIDYPMQKSKEDIKALIDLAIDTNNKEWFEELVKELS